MGYQRGQIDPYVYPGTTVLRNLAGLRDEALLRNLETELSVYRHAELLAGRVSGSFDLAHLKAIHHHLFQDVYSWAGELRTVDIAKGGSRFGSHQHIESYAKGVFVRLARDRSQWLRDGAPLDFPEKLAEYLGEINAMHPFRDGNGRAQRAFVGQLAAELGFRIHWGKISQREMIQASMSSLAGNDFELVSLIRNNLEPKSS